MKNLTDLSGLLYRILETEIQNNDTNNIAQSIGRKLVSHVNSINVLLENTTDISSCTTLTRAVFETYAVFNLLFIKGTAEEKQLRFDLWKIDALKDRQKFMVSFDDLPPDERTQFKEQIEDEKQQIEELKLRIRKNEYYKKLPNGYDKGLLNNAIWKFDTEKIQGYHVKTKIDMGIRAMVEKCGIKEIYLQDMYKYTSMHAHANYISVLQSDQLNAETFQLAKKHLGELNSILVTYFIKAYLELNSFEIRNYCGTNHVYYMYEKRI